MIDSNIILQNPVIVGLFIASLLGNCYFAGVFYRLRNVLKTYAKMTVERARITEDGQITIDDPDIIPFVKDTFSLMADIEALLHWITGYILNHPSTGWIKGYVPYTTLVVNSAMDGLEKPQEIQNDVRTFDPATQPAAQTIDQPAQPVSTPSGA